MPKLAAAPPASIPSAPQTPHLPGAGRRKRETGSGSGDRPTEGKASPKGRRHSSPARPSLEERHRVVGSWLHHLLVSDTLHRLDGTEMGQENPRPCEPSHGSRHNLPDPPLTSEIDMRQCKGEG